MNRVVYLLFTFVLHSFTLWGEEDAPYRKGKDYALFFAINNYTNWDTLRNPIKDARAIANDLDTYYGFKTEVVENPTKKQILDKLSVYREQFKFDEDAQLFVFFSGHGYYNKGIKQGFFIPADALKNDPEGGSYISHRDLRSRITAIDCRHILVAVDACYSGTFDEDIPKNRGDVEPYGRPGELAFQYKQYIKEKLRYQSRIFLTSGGKERTSDGVYHSPFAFQFLKALRASKTTNKVLTFNELYYAYMDKIRPKPRMGGFEGHEPEGEFVFVYEPSSDVFAPPPLPDRNVPYIPKFRPRGTYLYPALTIGAGAAILGSSYIFQSNANHYYDNYRETFPAANSDDLYTKANLNNKLYLVGQWGGIGVMAVGATWLTARLIRSRNNNLSYQPSLDARGHASFAVQYRF